MYHEYCSITSVPTIAPDVLECPKNKLTKFLLDFYGSNFSIEI